MEKEDNLCRFQVDLLWRCIFLCVQGFGSRNLYVSAWI